MSMKNSNYTIGNQTRVLPACNAVPQPTALPRAPADLVVEQNVSGAGLSASFRFSFVLKFEGEGASSFAQALGWLFFLS
jgi:hypothetical protein